MPYILHAQALLRSTPRPIHSDFLVAAVVSFLDNDGRECATTGVNGETCCLSDAICAERSALLQLRLHPAGCARVLSVYITSTAAEGLVFPGLLCRQFMAEAARSGTPGSDVRVVLVSPALIPAVAPPPRGLCAVFSLLEDLFPLPCACTPGGGGREGGGSIPSTTHPPPPPAPPQTTACPAAEWRRTAAR